MLGRLESCSGASRFDVGGEGGDVSSGGSARHRFVPGSGGSGRQPRPGRREDNDVVGSDMCGSGGHGGCRSGVEDGPDMWAPPVGGKRERRRQSGGKNDKKGEKIKKKSMHRPRGMSCRQDYSQRKLWTEMIY